MSFFPPWAAIRPYALRSLGSLVVISGSVGLESCGHRAAMDVDPKGQPPRAESPRADAAPGRPVLPESRWLPIEARDVLSGQMQRHGDDMSFLLASVVLLNFEYAVVAAENLASAPQVRKPDPDEHDTLNVLLPTEFFALQEELGEAAARVAAAARSRDSKALVSAYGQLATTCVRCHEVYLEAGMETPALDMH